jgi:general secretion pathway protein N
MKKVIPLAALAIISYAGFMVAELPASFAWDKAPELGDIELKGLSGTLWSGSANTVILNDIELQEVSWDLEPSALLMGKLVAELSVGDDFSAVVGTATVTYSNSGLQVEGLEADASADWLQQQASMALPVAAKGNINLVADSLIYVEGQCVELDATMAWERGRISSPLGEVKLGKANADLSCDGNTLEGKVRQSSNQLMTDATFSLNSSGTYSLKGSLAEGEELPQTLKNGLKNLGKPDAQGRYPLSFRGRI